MQAAKHPRLQRKLGHCLEDGQIEIEKTTIYTHKGGFTRKKVLFTIQGSRHKQGQNFTFSSLN